MTDKRSRFKMHMAMASSSYQQQNWREEEEEEEEERDTLKRDGEYNTKNEDNHRISREGEIESSPLQTQWHKRR